MLSTIQALFWAYSLTAIQAIFVENLKKCSKTSWSEGPQNTPLVPLYFVKDISVLNTIFIAKQVYVILVDRFYGFPSNQPQPRPSQCVSTTGLIESHTIDILVGIKQNNANEICFNMFYSQFDSIQDELFTSSQFVNNFNIIITIIYHLVLIALSELNVTIYISRPISVRDVASQEFDRRSNGYINVASPDYDNTMVDLIKLSPSTQSYKLLLFHLELNKYALRHS